ncbi:MAG: Gfo/Idh/MocA family oxidoreductase [Candidatus Rokubacteria bacterium]|nr:Gfo/Idh/MocA family oxidoreductase [Candidatus Rokubacteria bacterium]MBI3105439.1 Gfo/Idh/MocA family oxidoreductase [Candidatus Rokubacteria bacterium]
MRPVVEPKIRAGVVGAGHMGQYHILAFMELWEAELAGIVDVDRERARQLAASYGTRAFQDHRELRGLVDVATVAVPTHRHFEVTRDLLEAGIHVLVEKPMTTTLEEAKELFRVARHHGSVLHVGHVERFNGAVQELRKIVERPILIESRRLGPFAPRVQNDSVVMDLMIHDIDIVLGLVDGEPRKVTAVGSSVVSGLADVANVQVVFDSGTMATITASRATEEKIRTLAITQPDAYITLDYLDQDIQIHRRAAQEYSVNREAIRYRQASFVEHLFVHKDNPLKLELRHLISTARAAQATGRAELAEAEDLRSLAVALEVERMIREGRGETAWPEDLPWSAASA